MTRIRTVRVEHDDALAAALEPLEAHDYLAIDTEFMRERTYYPRLCLLQIANAGGCVLIDPLSVTDLDPLTRVLADRRYLKVLHAARQDLEVIRLALDIVPGPLFDTQIAAGLLGMPAQIGYGELVRQRLGLDLAKAHARADWSRRPLSAEQLDYAADDVRYLTALHADLCHALEHAGRLPWLFEETAALEDPGLYETLPADAWRRLRGLDRLKPAQRAVAKALAAWRERVARNSDRPRGWILSDDALRAIAERLPADVAALGAVASVPEGVTRKRGSELIALVAAAQADATTEQAVLPPARPEPALVNRVSRLMQIVRSESARLGVSQELLATRRDIERLVYSGDPGVLAEGWRSAVIGARLISS